MNRRTFLKIPAAAGLMQTSLAASAPANKRERMLGWLAGQSTPNYTPAAFFLHFGNDYKSGSAAAKRHLEFFHETGMDFVKIQFEQTYSRQEFLQKPADWSKLKLAKQLGMPENSVRRLLDLRHSSHMWVIDEALAKMNAELPIDLPKVARGSLLLRGSGQRRRRA